MVNPYSEESRGGILLRTFSVDVPESELVWHFDEEDRRVRCVGGSNGWMFQVDDCLPFPFPEHRYRIRAGVYHRLLRGAGDLVVEIQILDT